MLGWLLGSSARTAILQSDFSDRLEGITVADLMDDEPVTIPSDTPAERAYEDYFLRYQGWEWFAVVDRDERVAGIAHREPLRQVYEAGDHRPVGELVVPPGEDGQVRSDTPLEVLLASEPLRRGLQPLGARCVGQVIQMHALIVAPARTGRGRRVSQLALTNPGRYRM
jgi:hypothetical protein